MLVRDIMVREFVSVNPDISVKECVGILFKRHIGGVIVVNHEGKVVGVFTERDLIRVIAQDIPLTVLISDVMTTNVVTVSLDASFGEAKELMRRHRIRRVPVVDGDEKLVGLVSLRYLVDELFEVIPRTRSGW